ncbi:MAG: hypothetical protein U0M60_10165 [Clostridia bacterium]|nr:hypothetical protein [Clostridia bacterium]
MVNLPRLKYVLNKTETKQFRFGGIKHSAGARDGAIYDMENMALDDAPSLSVRKKRQKMPYDIEGKVYGIGSADKLFWCCDSLADVPTFYYDGEEKFPVSASEKTFAIINKYICIFPDKMYYSLWGDEAVNLKGEVTTYESLELLNEAMETSESIKDGDVYAVGTTEPYSYFQFNSQGKWNSKATTENHAIQTRWIYLMDSWGKLEASKSILADEYDVSSVSRVSYTAGKRDFEGIETPYIALYCKNTVEASKANVLPWVRVGDIVVLKKVKKSDGEVETEYVKVIGKEFVEEFTNNNPYMLYYTDREISLSETSYSKVTIERIVPDLSFAFCHDNRLWGVEKDKIYASKLGDPFNFTDYSMIADASWTVGIASSGPFTGGIAYNGYPTFFKEDRIIRVSGNYPSQYSTYETADVPGVVKGSSKSLAICNGYLYYLSPEGVCAYSGSYPSVIGEDIGEVLSYGCGGAGSDKYYLEASANEVLAVYVYDTRVRAWLKEEKLEAAGFTDIGRDLYALTEDGIYLLDSEKVTGDAETDFESFTEFAPIYDGHLTKKGLSKLHISLEASEGAKVSVYISYDGGEWIKAKEINSGKRQNYNIPLTIRRCGYYRIRIEGKGNYIIYAIGKVRYFGSDL